MKEIFVLLCSMFAILIASCSSDELSPNNNKSFLDATQFNQLNTDYNTTFIPLAKALYNAMKESKELRELIKNESLDQFNKEYEVLYQFIKEERVENGLSVRELLLKYFENEERLAVIEFSYPTLTIHIPILPAGSFSAEIWDTKEQIPAVAIHSPFGLNPVIVSEKGKYVKNSDEFVIESGHVPGFPVIVLKENARVVVSQNANSKYPSLNNRNSDYVFDFIDDYFDGSINDKDTEKHKDAETGLRSVSYWVTPLINQKSLDAYNIYGAYNGGQRDYVYYNITPTDTSGTLSQNFKESIISFKFNTQHTPQQVCNYIMNNSATDPPFPWTSGQFNFRIEVNLAAKNGYSPLITNYFSAYPLELFDVTFVKSGNNYIPTFNGFFVKSLNVSLMNWNLYNYGKGMKISICKMTPSASIQRSITHSSAFVNNVKYYDKEGKELGSTQTTTTSSSTYMITYQVSDVYLGDVLADFDEPVITGTLPFMGYTAYGLLDYSSSYYTVNMIPVQQY